MHFRHSSPSSFNKKCIHFGSNWYTASVNSKKNYSSPPLPTMHVQAYLRHLPPFGTRCNVRLATSRPLGEWSKPCLAASDEVGRGRLVSLDGFSICISRQKWGVAWLAFGVSGFICESLPSMAGCADSTPTKSIEHVCVSPSSKEQICLLCAKVVSNNDFRRKLTTSGGREKKETCFNPESTLGK